jgi:quinol monooxygenase YgiN
VLAQRTVWFVASRGATPYTRVMIVEYIRYEIADPEPFLLGYESARAALDTSPHCLGYELSRCTEEPTSFILRIEWDSADGHLKGFRKSPEFATFLGAVRPFIENIREMRHYAVTSVVSRKDRSPRA